jgi:hypothetical protein
MPSQGLCRSGHQRHRASNFELRGSRGLAYKGRVSDIEDYDPKTDQWTRKNAMPSPGAVSAVSLNGLIYTLGTGRICAYDPKEDSWIVKASFAPVCYITGIQCSGGTLRLAWDAEPGIKYAVQWRSDGAQGVWNRQALPAGSTIIATEPRVEVECPIQESTSQRFYRIMEGD